MAQGEKPISVNTLLKDINGMYRYIGFNTKITCKSAKCLGVSLAYEAGLTSEEVRILGRWRCEDTARHYLNISDRKILTVARTLTLATMDDNVSYLAQKPVAQTGTLKDSLQQYGPLAYVQHQKMQQQDGAAGSQVVKDGQHTGSAMESKMPSAYSTQSCLTNSVALNPVKVQHVKLYTVTRPKIITDLRLDSEGYPIVNFNVRAHVSGETNLDIQSENNFVMKLDM